MTIISDKIRNDRSRIGKRSSFNISAYSECFANHRIAYEQVNSASASLHLHKRQQKGSFIPQKLPKIKHHLFHEPMLPAANMIRTALRPG
jgi:hypothetical protein